MRLLTIYLLALSVFLISGCKEEAKTTKWYKDHPEELKAVYENARKQEALRKIVKMQTKLTGKYSS